ncbi:MAG: PDZ domain-containing protein [bacterium]|nr:PDZ domain-containing protein [bacterium]
MLPIRSALLILSLLIGTLTPTPARGNCLREAITGTSFRAEIASGEASVRIPFTTMGSHVVIPMQVNGSPEMQFVLDTGAPLEGVLLFEGPRLDDLNLELIAMTRLGRTRSNQDEMNTACDITVDLPGLKLSGLLAIVSPPLTGERTFDGVIGNSFFSHFVVRIDQDAGEIVLTEPESFTYTGGGDTIPFSFTNGAKLSIQCEVEQDGRSVEVPVLIDTGAWFGLHVDTSAGLDLPRPERKLSAIIGHTLYGRVMGEICRTDELRLGRFALTDVLTTLEVGESPVPVNDNIIGGGVLNNFNITYDHSRMQIHIEPCAGFDTRQVYDMTGFEAEFAEGRTWLIEIIHPDSPAAEAGLQVGDVIDAIDGKPLTDYTSQERIALTRTEGQTLNLSVLRGEETFDVLIQLRQLI